MQKPLAEIVELLGLSGKFSGEVRIDHEEPVIRSPHRLGEATAYALLAEAIAASCVWKSAGRAAASTVSLSVDLREALHSLHSTHFLWQNGYNMSVGAEFVPTNGLFKCKDGKYIMTESGPPYVKLERGYLNFFDCGNNRDAIAREIAKYDSEPLQEKLSALGLPASIAYTREEWLAHPQGQALSAVPLVEIEKIGESKPVPIEAGEFPLENVKVLDCTHVLAGPRSMRSLAQYGAEVLHISSPYHRDTVAQNMLVNFGKRSAYLLLSQADDQAKMKELLHDADVFSFSYRPGVAQKYQLTPSEIAKGHQKGIVCVSINAYGHSGPWRDRPGFDQNGQVATGFAMKEGDNKVPRFSPVFYLNDFLTGYLAAAGAMAALVRRAEEGGSFNVKVSLARTAMWVQSLGYIDPALFTADVPDKDVREPKLHTVDTDCGAIRELVPAVDLVGVPRKTLTLLRPFGSDKAEWSKQPATTIPPRR